MSEQSHPGTEGMRGDAPAIVRDNAPPHAPADRPPRTSSLLAEGLIGSPILRIAAEVRSLVAQGAEICNLTVGDFAPSEFPIPELLSTELTNAVRDGETNYPPSTGMPALRKAVVEFSQRRLDLWVQPEQVVITSGSRPVIYACYRILVDVGERVVYPVPSWNNAYYCQMTGAVGVPVTCDATTSFLPTAAMLAPHVKNARLIALNSPVNPTGTALTAAQLEGICDLVLEENARRAGRDRPLYLMYDQMYWMLTFGVDHVHPVALRPEMADYTIYVDGISKAFAATGLRVGWGIGPARVIAQMSDLLTHIGAWAPRPEQVATTALLNNDEEIDDYNEELRGGVLRRLQALHDGIAALRDDGFPVDATIPSGAIYLSAKFHLHGMRTPDGATLRTDDDVRGYILRSAGLAAVPFSAFGVAEGSGWFRLSVGAVSMKAIDALIPRLRTSLRALTAT